MNALESAIADAIKDGRGAVLISYDPVLGPVVSRADITRTLLTPEPVEFCGPSIHELLNREEEWTSSTHGHTSGSSPGP